MLISPEQVRAARALLRLDQDDLARRAGVSVVTIRRLEAPDGPGRVGSATVEKIQRALEAAGAEFIADGVRKLASVPRRDAEQTYREVRAIAERSAARQKELPPFTEEDLYDENGLPA